MSSKRITFEFETREYTNSHGAQPRGRGSWAFSTTADTPTDHMWFSPCMTFGEAKRAAAEHFRKALMATSIAPYCAGTRITLWVQP